MRMKTVWKGLVRMSPFVTPLGFPAFAWAEEEIVAGGASTFFSVSVATMGFALALAAVVAALSQSRAITTALDGMARQPGAAPRLQLALIIGLAFIESLVIYVLLIALLLFFANPYGKVFGL